MPDYIERGELQDKAFGRNHPTFYDGEDRADWYEHCINEAPTADVTSIRHGYWIDKPTGRYGQQQSWCSVCGKHSGIGGIESNRHKPYCPNCGAKMDLEG